MTRRLSSKNKIAIGVVAALLMTFLPFVESSLPADAQQASNSQSSGTAVPAAPPAPRAVSAVTNDGTLGLRVTVAPPSTTLNAPENGGAPLVNYEVKVYSNSPRTLIDGKTCSVQATRASFGGVTSEMGGTCGVVGLDLGDYVVTATAVGENGSSPESTISSLVTIGSESSTPINVDPPAVRIVKDASGALRFKAQMTSISIYSAEYTSLKFQAYTVSPRTVVPSLARTINVDANTQNPESPGAEFDLGEVTSGNTYEVGVRTKFYSSGAYSQIGIAYSDEFFSKKITASDTAPSAPAAPTVSYANGVVTATVAPQPPPRKSTLTKSVMISLRFVSNTAITDRNMVSLPPCR